MRAPCAFYGMRGSARTPYPDSPMARHIPFLFSLLLALLLLPEPLFAASRPQVLVSIAPQKYILERIAGESLEIAVLVKPGADPHAYEPTPGQIRSAGAARVWFTMGVPFEDVWLPRITGAAGELKTVSMLAGISRLAFHDHEDSPSSGNPAHSHHHHADEDPHVWLSPPLVRHMLPGIARELGNLLPEKTEDFAAAARVFAAELETLDADIAARFAAFPLERRVFLTFHPSWGYFAHTYQLTELCIESGGKEPGPRAMKTLVDRAKELGIRTVFIEPQFPRASADAIAAQLDARVVEADPLAEDLIGIYTRMTDALIASFAR